MNPNQILQRGGGIAWSTLRAPERLTRRAVGNSFGLALRVTHLRQAPKPEMDDATIAAKVESVIFRGANTKKSTVNVNVVDGVVWLRGEVKTANQVRSLETKTRSVPEVRGVENLLHLPKTPAPTRADSPRRQQRTRSSTKRATPRRTQGRVTDDRSDAIATEAEPSPQAHAREGTGRTPAPLGAQDTESPAAPVGAQETESPSAPLGAKETESPAAETPAPLDTNPVEQLPTETPTEAPASSLSAEESTEEQTSPNSTTDPKPEIGSPETERVP